MYYPYNENKDADQLRGNREADLRLCFRICKKAGFLITRLIFLSVVLYSFFSAALSPDRIGRNNKVTIDSNGKATVEYYREIKTVCDPVVNGMTIENPPMLNCNDEFDCEIQLNSWNHNDDEMKLAVSGKQVYFFFYFSSRFFFI